MNAWQYDAHGMRTDLGHDMCTADMMGRCNNARCRGHGKAWGVARLQAFWDAQSEWSQKTFGSDAVRGPVGALRHLQSECDEAIAEPSDVVEFADCLILLLDATRRAGHSLVDLVSAAERKAEINRARTWPTPPAVDDGKPLEHVEQEDTDAWYAAEAARLKERAPA